MGRKAGAYEPLWPLAYDVAYRNCWWWGTNALFHEPGTLIQRPDSHGQRLNAAGPSHPRRPLGALTKKRRWLVRWLRQIRPGPAGVILTNLKEKSEKKGKTGPEYPAFIYNMPLPPSEKMTEAGQTRWWRTFFIVNGLI